MNAAELGEAAERVFRDVLAPLVLGGALRPGKPIGAKAALELGVERVVADRERAGHVALGRVRVARALAPVDRIDEPTIAEWALGAALHDLLVAVHPELPGVFRRDAPKQLLAHVEQITERVPACATVGETLARHTLFSRVLDVARTDTKVSFWVGSRMFVGTEPPARLLAWPEVRRVNVDKTRVGILSLAAAGQVDEDAFSQALHRVLVRSPLTDVACCVRPFPFVWSPAALSLVACPGGRTLALRALAKADDAAVDRALGAATRALFAAKQRGAAAAVLGFLAERSLASALGPSKAPRAAAGPDDDGALARALGAIHAREQIAETGLGLDAAGRAQALAALRPFAQGEAAVRASKLVEIPAS